jgi:hypothetical protein
MTENPATTAPNTFTYAIDADTWRSPRAGGRKRLTDAPPPPPGRVPRVARILALAIKLDGLVRQGHVRDLADIGRLGNVSRARVTQILDLTLLAPEIQEAILDLPLVVKGRDSIKEWQLRKIVGEPDWNLQRKMWARLQA